MTSPTASVSIVIYTTPYCAYCVAAKRLLDSKGVLYREIPVGGRPDLRSEMESLSGRRTVPQVFIDNRPVGGFDSLRALEASGELNRLLFGSPLPGCA